MYVCERPCICSRGRKPPEYRYRTETFSDAFGGPKLPHLGRRRRWPLAERACARSGAPGSTSDAMHGGGGVSYETGRRRTASRSRWAAVSGGASATTRATYSAMSGGLGRREEEAGMVRTSASDVRLAQGVGITPVAPSSRSEQTRDQSPAPGHLYGE